MKLKVISLFITSIVCTHCQAQDINFSSEYNTLRFPLALSYQGGITGDDGTYKKLTLFHGNQIVFQTGTNTVNYANTRMLIANNGFVGIGTTSPAAPLSVTGSTGAFSTTAHLTASFLQDQTNNRGVYLGYDSAGQIGLISSGSNGAPSQLSFWNYSGTNWLEAMRLSSTGNLLIGQTTQVNTNYKLDVNGSARANQIVVNATGADFVFDSNYKLRKLSEVKSYINANHRLPEIPSAAQMKKDGLDVGELNIKLLQKIEELTLYLLDKNDELNAQNVKLKAQEARIAALEKALIKSIGNK